MKIEDKEIHFGIDKPVPYFQVGDEHRIRFGYERMKGSLIKKLLPTHVLMTVLIWSFY